MTQTSRTEQWRKALLGDSNHTRTESFADLVLQYPIPREEKETGVAPPVSPTTTTTSDKPLDPLTAMYMQDLHEQTTLHSRQMQYQQKRRMARQPEHESLTREEQQSVSWQILQKDLHRLKDPSTNDCLAHRHALIAQVLFVWLCHTNTEYQQGMHEVVSYLLYALEVDASTKDTVHATASGDLFFCQTLLDLVAVVLPAILPAYDPSLQQMTQRILHLLQQYQPAIYQRLKQLPLQLVFCKWIRLLFAREVCDVLVLWDALFPYHNCGNANDTNTTTLLKACEALCVARLLVHRDWILETSNNAAAPSHQPDDLLHWLMNLAPEESLELLIPLFSRIVQHASVEDLLPPVATTKHTNNHAATTSSWTDPLSQAFSQFAVTPARVQHNDNTNTANTNNNAFSVFKERWVQPSEHLLTQKIHSVSQRLFASNHHQQEQIIRDYSDPGMTPYRTTTTTTTTTLPQGTAQQMQQALNTMAAYLMEQPHVPLNVQQAMAELQVIQQDMSRQNY